MERKPRRRPEKLGAWAIAALVSLPLLAVVVSVYSLGYYVREEPFGRLHLQDASVMLGGLVLILGLWLAWGWVVWQSKAPAVVWGPLSLWIPITLWLGVVSFLAYFRQPWHDWKPLF